MGVSLLRFLPLSHPVMADALARMETADPAPEIMMEKNDSTREALSDRSMSYRYTYREIFENYAAEGHKVIDRNAEKFSYGQIKLLELISKESMIVQLISKGNPASELGKVQQKTARRGLEMVDAMARMTDFNPGLNPRFSEEWLFSTQTPNNFDDKHRRRARNKPCRTP